MRKIRQKISTEKFKKAKGYPLGFIQFFGRIFFLIFAFWRLDLIEGH